MTKNASDPSVDPAFVRPEIRRLMAYVPGEQPRDRAYLKLNTNENPYPPSPRVLDAVRASVTGDLRRYPDPSARALRDKAAAVYDFPWEGILAGNGSDDLLALVLRACAGPGDRVAYPTPTYSLYEVLVAIQGATAIEVPFLEGFELPMDGLREQGQTVTFICNPNAPSGTFVHVPVLDELARRLRGLLVIDEAYVDFAGDSALRLAKRHRNVLVLRTFSKSFSLCGLRIGLAFGDPQIVAALAKVKDSYNVNHLGLVAAEAALDDYGWMEANADRVRHVRAALTEGLRELRFECCPSEANFVFARQRSRDMASVQRKLRENGVLVRHFEKPGLRDALRITVGTEQENETLLAALREIAGNGDLAVGPR